MYDVPACEVSVLLTNDAALRELNQQYRGIDAATDVLTFPGGDYGPLGDIAISVDTAKRQARFRRDTLANEIVFLTIHGGLHLLGYEDETEAGRDEMVVRMNAVAVELGLSPEPEWSSMPH
ncbi:MAG: rRNA maturation RNase YbeY [Chthonomonas sp.]|nr:rRNA maturation RNase YbeY [Chthonomonas sp.]